MKPIQPIAEKDFNYKLGDTFQETLMKLFSVLVIKLNEVIRVLNEFVDKKIEN